MVRETNLAVARVSAQQIYDTAMIAAGMIEEPKVRIPLHLLLRRISREDVFFQAVVGDTGLARV